MNEYEKASAKREALVAFLDEKKWKPYDRKFNKIFLSHDDYSLSVEFENEEKDPKIKELPLSEFMMWNQLTEEDFMLPPSA